MVYKKFLLLKLTPLDYFLFWTNNWYFPKFDILASCIIFTFYNLFKKKKDYKFLWATFSEMNEDTQKGQLV